MLAHYWYYMYTLNSIVLIILQKPPYFLFLPVHSLMKEKEKRKYMRWQEVGREGERKGGGQYGP